jgi:hypothetical protein
MSIILGARSKENVPGPEQNLDQIVMSVHTSL